MAEVIAGIVALVVALGTLARVLGEVTKLRLEVAKAARTAQETQQTAQATHNQLKPNHGHSTRDALDRIESSLHTFRQERILADQVHEELHNRISNLERCRRWRRGR